MILADGVLPFYLTGGSDRTLPLMTGRVARLGPSAHQILARHSWPDPVNEVAAEAMALAACLASQMTVEGVFTLQAKGDGPIKTLFADVTHEGDIRSYAAFDEAQLAGMAPGCPAVLPRLMGSGYMAFTIDQQSKTRPDGQRYQGIVELEGPHLGDAAHLWFKNSEQLASVFLTAAGRTPSGWCGAAMMLQIVAGKGGLAGAADFAGDAGGLASLPDIWHEAVSFFSSVRREELLDQSLPLDQLIYRLFHMLAPHIQPALTVRDKCRCSADKVEAMLGGLDEASLDELANEQGQLVVDCEFCKTSRTYDRDQLPGLLSTPN